MNIKFLNEYKNEDIVANFADKYNVTNSEAEIFFDDMKALLYLTQRISEIRSDNPDNSLSNFEQIQISTLSMRPQKRDKFMPIN